MTVIFQFSGKYEWLSNFYESPITHEGLTYPSLENAYQASKVPTKDRGPFTKIKPSQSKKMGRSCELPPNWESIKLSVMRDLIAKKFERGSELAEKLLGTGNSTLIEGNWWGDQYWGVCDNEGENWLGKLLMERRRSLLYKFPTFEDWYNSQEGFHLVGELFSAPPSELRAAFSAARAV